MEKGSYIATKLTFPLNLQLFADDVDQNQGENTPTPEGEPNPPEVNDDHPPMDRQFSRDEVTTIVKKRTERAIKNILKEFGLENKEDIGEYLTKVQDSQTKYGELDNQYKSLMREHLYLKNNIIPEKYEDLDKNFADGLTEEKLLEVLKSHPEFVKPKVVIPEKVGQTGNTKPQLTEKEMAEKLLHVKF